MRQTVAVRYRNGSVRRGTTDDFAPHRSSFTLIGEDGRTATVRLSHLKALFFVRGLSGVYGHPEEDVKPVRETPLPVIEVAFRDGERLRGQAIGHGDAGAVGFYLEPLDRTTNNIRVFVVRAAVASIRVV